MQSLRACRVCLATGGSLIPIEPFLQCYLHITGYNELERPGYLCYECAAHMYKYQRFREKCLKSLALYNTLLVAHNEITLDTIDDIDREAYDLESPLKICHLKHWEVNCNENIWSLRLDTLKEESLDVKPDVSSPINIDSENGKPFKFSNSKPKKTKKETSEKNNKTIAVLKIVKTKKGTSESISQYMRKLKHRKDKRRTKSNVSRAERAEFFSKFVDVVLMTQEEARDVIVKRKESLNYTTSTYQCDLCYKGFWEESAFKNHKKTHDPSKGPFECDFCRVRVASRATLAQHIRARHKWKFCCRRCPNVCNDGIMAKKHEAWHNGASYSCVHCCATFTHYTTMRNHVRIKHAREYACSACGLCFVGRRGVRVHSLKAHAGDEVTVGVEEHMCVECDIKFVTAEALKRHRVVSSRHNLRETANGCAVCGEVFPTREAYVQHRRSHARNLPAQWARRKNTVKMAEMKTETEPGHVAKPRVKRAASEGQLGGARGGLRSLMCEICGKVYLTVTGLRGHQRKHSGERPHQCTACPKTFSVRELLRSHLRTHTRERPHRCAACGRAFTCGSNLSRHTKLVHSDSKPVHCDICNKPFKNTLCMKDHIKYVHMKVPYPVRRTRARKEQNRQAAEES